MRIKVFPYSSAAAPDASLLPTPPNIINRTTEFTQQLSRYWSELHVGYRGGTYSIERLVALQEYATRTSPLRVGVVCFSAPTFVATFILALESIPLQDPHAKWSEQYGFWIRVAVFSMVVSNAFLVQVKHFVEGCVISPRQLLLIIFFMAILETPLVVLVAAYTTFPIPFSIITMAPTFYPLLLGLFCVFVPRDVIREMLKHYDHIVRYLKFTAALQAMAIIYPIYQTLFHYVHKTKFELPVMLLLPIIKLVLKNVIMRTATHIEDKMPEAVIFTVDFFNALYVSSSVETATSTSTVVVVVLIDIIQTVVVLYRLNRRAALVRDVWTGRNDLLSAAFRIYQSIDEFKRQNRQCIRIRSCLAYDISIEGRDLLTRLESASRCASSDTSRRHSSPAGSKLNLVVNRHKINKASTWVDRKVPTILTPAGTILIAESRRAVKLPAKPHPEHLRKTLELLFTTECLLLSATLDVLVPIFYGHFLLLMVRLPNGKYHTELAGATSENIGGIVDTIFIYSFVEAVSFVALAGLIYRTLAMNALYHVAFVLETHSELIRAKLLTWMLMTTAFRVIHFGKLLSSSALFILADMMVCCLGIDFTFKFAWLSS